MLGDASVVQYEGDTTENDQSADTEVVAFLRTADVARLDHAAARRGISRAEMVAEAVDAFLAREMWSGGFIAPPPPMEVPGPFPWRRGAFRLHRPKTER
jgi:hypothetical protein